MTNPALPTARHLAGFSLPAQHPVSREWVDDELRLDLLTEQHELDVELLTDREIAALRTERFAPGRPIELMFNQWVRIAADQQVMLSMRYEGGDPAKPFVDASALSRPLQPGDVRPAASAASEYFGSLDPKYLRLWSSKPIGSFPGCLPDKRFLAGPLDVLRRAGERVPEELTLVEATSLANYEHAQAAYAAVDAAHPEHSEQAQLQSRDKLESTVEDGLLFDVLVDGTWAGYIAASPEGQNLGLPAYIVQDIILTPDYRGQGYGPHLTTLLARALHARNQLTFLLGTIHANNQGALTAALTAGRTDLGGWHQFPLSIDGEQ
ncbi:acetyltransferase (GNAT) family protein [Kribbella voronezhensis]|uniref:Acetyltransferase (GNAT) family protein n=1 Tax=Kribbella voronezhensis TaxID=2512212 RepID=A0A4R7SU75_9ACTN|nr:GNAT family N-acetyltransferase [Kribbella voronezhensis]TDU82299.1 acetyltransferase (GNAT) family protein [Kribbella voronezhensis]